MFVEINPTLIPITPNIRCERARSLIKFFQNQPPLCTRNYKVPLGRFVRVSSQFNCLCKNQACSSYRYCFASKKKIDKTEGRSASPDYYSNRGKKSTQQIKVFSEA